MSWATGNALAFDTESTGIDIESDRIVTVSLVRVGDGRPIREHWLINPGVEIPQGAIDVHGITNEKVRAEGVEPAGALEATATALTEALTAGVPVVGMNLPYDFSLFDRDCRRNGVTPLSERLPGGIRPVIDIYVIDKQVDRFRRGSRKLDALCAHYGVKHYGAHDSAYDALASAQVAAAIADRYPEIGEMSLDELHDAQVGWRAEQMDSLREYFSRQGKDEVCDGRWPLIPLDRGR